MKKEYVDEGPKYQAILDYLEKQPITSKIDHFIESKILPQVDHFKSLLAPADFKDYIRREISSAQKAMSDIINVIKDQNTYRTIIINGNTFRLSNYEERENGIFKARPEAWVTKVPPKAIENYLWNKERIRVYNEELHSKTGPKPGRKRNFNDLFVAPGIGDMIKTILRDAEVLDDNFKWIAQGNKKEVALPFWVLRDEDTGFCVIKPTREKGPQLTTWAAEFGIIATPTLETGSDVTVNNLKNRPEYDVTDKVGYIRYRTIFEDYRDKLEELKAKK